VAGARARHHARARGLAWHRRHGARDASGSPRHPPALSEHVAAQAERRLSPGGGTAVRAAPLAAPDPRRRPRADPTARGRVRLPSGRLDRGLRATARRQRRRDSRRSRGVLLVRDTLARARHPADRGLSRRGRAHDRGAVHPSHRRGGARACTRARSSPARAPAHRAPAAGRPDLRRTREPRRVSPRRAPDRARNNPRRDLHALRR
jgi:hypothetical protein